MPDLTWSNTLANVAESQIDSCVFAHHKPNSYGENLYAGYQSAGTMTAYQAAGNACASWADEEQYGSNHNFITCYADDNYTGHTCGHYTQQVWNATTQIGCAVKNCPLNDKTYTFAFCEYNPRGNFNKRNPY